MQHTTAKVSSRTRSRTRHEATMQPFLQDSQNLDLIGLVLQQLLDSTEGHKFAFVDVVREHTDHAGVVHKFTGRDCVGGIFEGIQYDYYKCTHAVVQALSLVCRLWDEVRSPITRAPTPPRTGSLHRLSRPPPRAPYPTPRFPF